MQCLLKSPKGRWKEAEERASRLVARLGSSLPLYVHFYRADNATGSKEDDSLIWFEQFLRGRGIDVPPVALRLLPGGEQH
ncbi:MAG TPA: hypothetical protein VF026_32485 [Ktedonobacteraceae bacterium]